MVSDVFLELVSTLRGTNCAGPTASKWNLPTTKGDQRKDVEPSRASEGQTFDDLLQLKWLPKLSQPPNLGSSIRGNPVANGVENPVQIVR